MSPAYEPVASRRFSVEDTLDGVVIRVRAPRPLIPTLFLMLWVVSWTAGGGAGLWALRSGGGAVTFEYGARTLFAAPGLDEAEGREIAQRLLRRLPSAR